MYGELRIKLILIGSSIGYAEPNMNSFLTRHPLMLHYKKYYYLN